LISGVLLMFAGVGLLIALYFFVFVLARGFCCACVVYECRNMGIPLAPFAFGQDGMQRATLMFVIMMFHQYSLGI